MKVEASSYLLVASMLDPNNQILPIAWGIYAGPENKRSWLRFLRFINEALIEANRTIFEREEEEESVLNTPRFAFISDRGTGLLPTIS